MLQWNQNVEFEPSVHHLLSPVNSENPQYIRSKINDQITGTSVTAVLIGDHTEKSEWVDYEIKESLARGHPVIGIRLKGHEDAPVPPALNQAGGKVIDWEPQTFSDEIERQALISSRPLLGAGPTRSGHGSSCGRQPRLI